MADFSYLVYLLIADIMVNQDPCRSCRRAWRRTARSCYRSPPLPRGVGVRAAAKGAEFHNQTLWASIGWATPAAFGAAIGAPERRLILITGEGSHQMTAQEIGQFGRHRLRPIIFVLNNSGYLSERLRCKGILTAKDWAGPRRRAGGRRPYAEICLS
jgi:hypothetical protein